ncbi:MAG: Do family serine endopeptidase [Candidatus Omnitrophica bacterium]|nr:Do family serine endopeptidase [Candidatus Omnitrophota bacterium]
MIRARSLTGVVASFCVALAAFSFLSSEVIASVEELEESFGKVAREIGPAVVSISTEHVERIETLPFYGLGELGPEAYQDEFFRQFFKEFFGGIPEREIRRLGLGSGVIINPDGYILTNEHVIQGADRITVTLSDGREFQGTVRGTDYRSDLAIIKIEARGLPTAVLGDSDRVKIGQWAIAIGNPFGYALMNSEPTVTVGVISALNRSLRRTSYRERDYGDLMQTDAAINPGNSGGPLVNIHGEVIGINVAIIAAAGGPPAYQGMGFAIPVNTAKFILADLISGREVQYGWLGVNIQDLDEALARYFNFSDRDGVLVAYVFKGSPADEAGLREGDIIRQYNGEPIRNVRDLIKKVGHTTVGNSAQMQVFRTGKFIDISIRIEKRPTDITELGTPQPEEGRNWRGLSVQAIAPQLAERLQIDVNAGVLVVDVIPGSQVDEAGLRPGHIIREIDKNKIDGISSYNAVVGSVKGEVLVRTNRGYVVVRE